MRKTDWVKFRKLIHKVLKTPTSNIISSTVAIDDAIDEITKSIISCHSKCCPLIRPRKKKYPVWWNDEVRDLRLASRKQFNKAKKSRDEIEWQVYKQKLRLFKKAVCNAKEKSWADFCQEIESTSETARLRKLMSKTSTAPSYLMDESGLWSSSSCESLNILFQTHFPGCSDEPVNYDFIQDYDYNSAENTDEIITEEKIKWAISSFAPYKSPGPDCLIPAMLQESGPLLVKWLLLIFKSCFKLNYVPKKWKTVTVIFIPKAGKPSHVKPKDFRPISLSSFLLKTLERLLEVFIRNHIPSNLLSSSQHAYTKGRSVETALHEVVHSIENTFRSHEFMLAAFLDIEGAFNNISLPTILNSLRDLNMPSKMVRYGYATYY